MTTILSDVQQKLANLKKNEADIRKDSKFLTDLWNNIQDLKREMYAAKKKAAEEAEKPYIDAISEIEKKYALLLKLQS